MNNIRLKLVIFINIFILIFLLQNVVSSDSIILNEIMINPIESDHYHEWIECYNPTNQSINLSNWTITDNTATDTLEPNPEQGNGSMVLHPRRYCIITDLGTKLFEHISTINQTLYLSVDDATIGNGLGNTNDKLILKDNNGTIIDSLEWGENYPDVPGNPITLTTEGTSLIRSSMTDSNDTLSDFTSTSIPTPGEQNILTIDGTLTIQTYPTYIAKPFSDEQYGYPFSIYVKLEHFKSSSPYEIKASILGQTTTHAVASQTWDNTQWQYSDRYAFNITTDEQGNWSHWIHLRINKNYIAYAKHIQHNQTAILQIKIRDAIQSFESTEIVHLLDMDSSSTNGIKGGYYTDILTGKQINPVDNKTILLKDQNNTICGIYLTENNHIAEGFLETPGYIKIPAPIGKNHTIHTSETSEHLSTLIESNITVNHGKYKVTLLGKNFHQTKPHRKIEIPVTVHNKGHFSDEYKLSTPSNSNGWNIKTSHKTISLQPNEQKNITITISPCNILREKFKHGAFNISIQSNNDPDAQDSIHIEVELIAPDITLPTIKTYNQTWNEQTTFQQGENINIKAYCKNIGNKNASNVKISYYLDYINETQFIESKSYDEIGSYQKYPSITVDTSTLNPGNHTFYIIADKNDTIKEIDEYNNEQQIIIHLLNTTPTKIEKQILITEFYYDNHPGITNEYICIHNPTNQSQNISQWYITNTPNKQQIKQRKIQFPDNTILQPLETIILTQNASAYHRETGTYPHFEYHSNSIQSIPQLLESTTLTLSDKGCSFALKNPFNHTIDFITYGNQTTINTTDWIGNPIPLGSNGQIFKRNQENNIFIDTNTHEDWKQNRLYFIGQTDLTSTSISGIINFTTFVSPDCSYHAITRELNQATQSIYLNMYEFTNIHLCNELLNCLKRNITVTLLLEGSPVGGIIEEEWYILHRLSTYGAKIYLLTNNNDEKIFVRYPFNHAKYVIIDENISIIESCNWASTGIPNHPTWGNREWGIIIRNETLAQYLTNLFFMDCNATRQDIISFHTMNQSIDKELIYQSTSYEGEYDPSFLPTQYQEQCTITPIISPDTSLQLLQSLISKANESIYIEQLYIYPQWDNKQNPLIEQLILKAEQGVDIKVLLNYNPTYNTTNTKCNTTKEILKKHGIEVRYLYINSTPFTNMHNKGLIIDNQSVLISSINWNENSIMKNRELGVIIESENISKYYAEVFFCDWNFQKNIELKTALKNTLLENSKNSIYIVSVFTVTFIVIAHDWRKRKWQ